VVTVDPQEAFAALSGLGVKDERTCCTEVIEPLFAEHGIKAHGRQLEGTVRYYLDSLEFKDGTRLHFAPSPHGAVIYRVTKGGHSYLKEVPDAG
jgi:hypothetical protein